MVSDSRSDEELILLLRRGETGVVEYLLEKYKPLVRKKARTMYLAGGDVEDLIQEGMMGLYKAIRDFDHDREASFAAFAAVCVQNQIYSAVEAAARKKHDPLNRSVPLQALDEQGYADNTASEGDPEQIFLEREAADSLLERLEHSLSRMEREVLHLFLSGLDYHQIAETMKKPEKSIDNALQRIRKKVKIMC